MNNEGLFGLVTGAYATVSASFQGIATDLGNALWETVYMVLASTVFSLALGFCLSRTDGRRPARGL